MQVRDRDATRRLGAESATGSVPAREPAVPLWAGWFLVVVGLGVAGLWAASLPGAFEQGLTSYAGTRDTGTIPLFHVLAEGLMATTALLAGSAVIVGRRSGRTLALVASGMLMYSSINASGWLLHNQPATLGVTAATFIGSALVVSALIRRGSPP